VENDSSDWVRGVISDSGSVVRGAGDERTSVDFASSGAE
jgi:hypothetical protein